MREGEKKCSECNDEFYETKISGTNLIIWLLSISPGNANVINKLKFFEILFFDISTKYRLCFNV